MLVSFKLQVVTDLGGTYIAQVGSSGEEGLRDGSFDDAAFNRRQVIICEHSCTVYFLFFTLSGELIFFAKLLCVVVVEIYGFPKLILIGSCAFAGPCL